MSQSSSSFRLIQRHLFSFGGKSGDKVGADRRIRPRGLDPLDRAHRVGAAVAALHPLQDHVVAGLKRQMEMRHQPRLAGDQLEQRARRSRCCRARTGAGAVRRGSAASRRWQSAAETALIIGDVDAGEHDFLRAAVDLARDGVADRLEGQGDAWPARLPDRAEGAAMVAAGLHRDEASDVAMEARDWRHDVICRESC